MFVAVILGLILVSSEVYSAPEEDLITKLPGISPAPRFQQYSGYLDGRNGNRLHYWFVESELAPKTAPVVLWLTGGPGCSSLYALLTENGPFKVNEDGKTLQYNPYSWNKVASVLYLESPVGVGFSYSSLKNYTTDDNVTAENNLEALISFFTKFPEYRNNDFYISGESYGGFYVPVLSVLVIEELPSLHFKGILIGNGLHSAELNTNSAIIFARGHGLFEEKIMIELLTYCCNYTAVPLTCKFYKPDNENCTIAISEASFQIALSGVNPYGIFNKCDKPTRTSWWLKRVLKTIVQKGVPRLDLVPPCVNPINVKTWLNQPRVREALHIPKEVQDWDVCSDAVSRTYRVIYATMSSQYDDLLDKVKALVYHGDTDMMCSFYGGEWFVSSLERQLLKPYTRWTYQNQTAGFFTSYSNITYATVLGAGHMAPTDRPGPTLKLISNFLYNKPLD